MKRYITHSAHEQKAERDAESHVAGFRLVKCDEGERHGRYLLKGNWSWAEVVTLSNGVYVGGDIETVVFRGNPTKSPRGPLYWMATRSYGYAREKASLGDVESTVWDRRCARERVIWMRRDKELGADEAREIVSLLDRECDRYEFQQALHDATHDCESLDAGQVVAPRVYMATAVLRKLVELLEARDFRESSKSWFLNGEAA